MIPISDSVRSRSVPYVNIAIILTCIMVFLYEVYLSEQVIRGSITELDRFIFRWGNIPGCTFDAAGVDTSVSLAQQRARCDGQPQPLLTLFSAMFLHGGWLHLAGNMLFLWIFGDNVEDAMGHLRYLLFYLLVGALAGLTHGFIDINDLTPAIGASGAIAGVMGAYIVLFPRAWVAAIFFIIIPIPMPAWVLIGFWFLQQLFIGFSSLGVDVVGGSGGVAYFAHIGGFVAGAVLVKLFVLGRPRVASSNRRH